LQKAACIAEPATAIGLDDHKLAAWSEHTQALGHAPCLVGPVLDRGDAHHQIERGVVERQLQRRAFDEAHLSASRSRAPASALHLPGVEIQACNPQLWQQLGNRNRRLPTAAAHIQQCRAARQRPQRAQLARGHEHLLGGVPEQLVIGPSFEVAVGQREVTDD